MRTPERKLHIVEALERRQLLAQITSMVAEQLAREVAYRDWAVNDTVAFQTNPMPYVVSQVWHDDKTSFDAYGLTSADNSPVLVLRGSEFFPNNFKFKDLFTDADPKGVGYEQFATHWRSVRTWLKAQNASVDFVGHSLGGALAQWFAAAWSNATDAGAGANGFPVDQVHTFCSPGISSNRVINPGLITYASGPATPLGGAGFDPAKAVDVTHHITLGDIVSMAGEEYIKGNVVTYGWPEFDIPLKHTRPVLNQQVSPTPTDTLSRFANLFPTGAMTSAALSANNYVHNDADNRATVACIQIVADALSVVDPTYVGIRLAPALLMRRDTVETGRKILGSLLRAITDQFNLTQDNGVWKITLGGQTNGLFKATTFFLDPSVTFTVDTTGPTPSLKIEGKMRLNLPVPPGFPQIPLPDEFGGPITADHILQLNTLDVSGLIDKDKMKVSGQLTLIGGVGTVNGSITFDWTKAQITIDGNSNFMNGFVATDGGLRIASNLSITGSGDATVNVPNNIKLVGGKNLASGTFDFSFDPTNLGASYMEGVGTYKPFGLDRLAVTLGARTTLAGGLTVIAGDERFVIIPARLSGVSTGATFDIPPNKRWLLMQNTWSIPSGATQIRVIDPSQQVYDESEISAHPDMEIVPGLSNSFSRTVAIADPAPGLWRIEFVDASGLGTSGYVAYVDLPGVGATFGTITGGARRQPVQIHLDVTDSLGTSTVALYYDFDGDGFNGALIADNLVPNAGAIDYTWNVAAVPAGVVHLYAVVSPPTTPTFAVYAPAPVLISEVRPEFAGGRFLFDDFHAIEVAFDQDVFASLAVDDFLLTNLTTGQQFAGAQFALTYDAYLNIAALRSSTILPDGIYQLTAPATAISNSAGETLADDLSFNFHVLAGDANHDGLVNLADFQVLATNFNDQYMSFRLGDFNYDRTVNAADFTILASRFGTQLLPASFAVRGGLKWRMFNDSRIEDSGGGEVVLPL